MAFKRLIRFAMGDCVSYGDLLSIDGGTYKTRRLNGDPFTGLLPTEEIIHVNKVSFTSNKFVLFPFNDLPATLSH